MASTSIAPLPGPAPAPAGPSLAGLPATPAAHGKPAARPFARLLDEQGDVPADVLPAQKPEAAPPDTVLPVSAADPAAGDGEPECAEAAPGDAAALLASLAALQAPARPVPPPPAAGGGSAAPDGQADHPGPRRAAAAADEPLPGAAAATPAAGPKPDKTAPDAPTAAPARFTEVLQAVQSATRRTEGASRDGQPGPAPEARPAEAALPLPLPQAAPAAGAVSAAPPADARLAAPVGSPDFASQLGVQISTFVREGVQHAHLELHPLELGPVTVQIQLDGTTAQVHLAADQAVTRQALEQAMPMLAGSLREAGLTLTGGGVSEQPRQPQDQAGGSNAGSASNAGGTGLRQGADEAPAARTMALPARRRGVVDLVA